MTQHIKALTTLTFLFTLACGGDGFGTNDDGSASDSSNSVQTNGGTAGDHTQVGGNAQTGGDAQAGGIAQAGATQTGGNSDAGLTETDTMPKTDTQPAGELPKTSEVLQYLTRVPPYVMFVTTGLKGDPILPRIRCGIFMPKIGDPCYADGGSVQLRDYEIYSWSDGGFAWNNDGPPHGEIVATVLTDPDVMRFKIDRPALMFWPRPHQSPPGGYVKIVPKTLDDWILENSASLAGKTGSDLAATIDALTQPPNIPGITCVR